MIPTSCWKKSSCPQTFYSFFYANVKEHYPSNMYVLADIGKIRKMSEQGMSKIPIELRISLWSTVLVVFVGILKIITYYDALVSKKRWYAKDLHCRVNIPDCSWWNHSTVIIFIANIIFCISYQFNEKSGAAKRWFFVSRAIQRSWFLLASARRGLYLKKAIVFLHFTDILISCSRYLRLGQEISYNFSIFNQTASVSLPFSKWFNKCVQNSRRTIAKYRRNDYFHFTRKSVDEIIPDFLVLRRI